MKKSLVWILVTCVTVAMFLSACGKDQSKSTIAETTTEPMTETTEPEANEVIETTTESAETQESVLMTEPESTQPLTTTMEDTAMQTETTTTEEVTTQSQTMVPEEVTTETLVTTAEAETTQSQTMVPEEVTTETLAATAEAETTQAPTTTPEEITTETPATTAEEETTQASTTTPEEVTTQTPATTTEEEATQAPTTMPEEVITQTPATTSEEETTQSQTATIEEETTQPPTTIDSGDLVLQSKLVSIYNDFMENGWDKLLIDYRNDSIDRIEEVLKENGWDTARVVQNQETNDEILVGKKPLNESTYKITFWKWSDYTNIHFEVTGGQPSREDNLNVLQGLAPDTIIETLGLKTFNELISMDSALQITATSVSQITWLMTGGEQTLRDEYWYEWPADSKEWSLSWYEGNEGEMYYHIGPSDNYDLDVGFLQTDLIHRIFLSY